ncbi:MAG: response regulator, partial [Isosphaeraceae bacterium]
MSIEPLTDDEVVAARRALRILIVEDHPGTQRAVQLLLRWIGCEACTVNDGWEAVLEVRKREFDLILMDVMMPVMDGLEAARRIRVERAMAGVPRIVAMSGDATGENRETCLAAGMDGFLGKPFSADDLMRVLDETVL